MLREPCQSSRTNVEDMTTHSLASHTPSKSTKLLDRVTTNAKFLFLVLASERRPADTKTIRRAGSQPPMGWTPKLVTAFHKFVKEPRWYSKLHLVVTSGSASKVDQIPPLHHYEQSLQVCRTSREQRSPFIGTFTTSVTLPVIPCGSIASRHRHLSDHD
jgi:hypothetical protein